MNGSSLVTLSSSEKAAEMEQALAKAIDSKSSKKVKADDKKNKVDSKAKVDQENKTK